MALSQIRVQVNGTWYTLTYNSATKRYETTLSLSASSYGQTGGYYNAAVEATNSSGVTVTKTGADMESLRLVVRETGAPSLALVSPAQGYLTTARPTITVDATDVGTGIDPNSIVVKVDGTTVTATRTAITNGYRLTYTPTADLSQGAHTLTVTASDFDGNSGSLSASWTVDTVAPVLAVENPANNAILTTPSLTIRGTVSDATSGLKSLTINGTAVTVSAGTFSYPVTLAEGVTTFTIVATDNVGKQSTVTRTVTYDAGAPIITVNSPTDGLITTQKTLTTTGKVVETGTGVSSFKINGQSVDLSGEAFSLTLSLSEGEQTITYEAVDGSGQTASTTRTVTLDTAAPSLTVTSPTDGAIVTNPSLTVTGTVSDTTSGIASVTVNGEAATVSGTSFSKVLTLTEGTHTITVIVTDRAGNKTTVTRSVTYDAGAPVITVDSPTNGTASNKTEVITSGTVVDTGTGVAAFTINGQNVSLSNNAFAVTLTLPEGTQEIIYEATDRAGLTSTVRRTVTVDTVPPSLNITSPTEGLEITLPSLTVSGTVSDATSGVTSVTVNGTAVPVSGGTFSTTLTLPEGYHTITVTAKDALGNETTATRSVTYDAGAPVITVLAPSDGLVTNQRKVTTSGTVVETGTGVDSFTINGQEVSLTGDSFSADLTLTEGRQSIVYIAKDRTGKTTTETRTVTLDTIPPAITVTSPAEGAVFGVSQITVTGTVSDSGTGLAWVEVDGQAVTVTDGAFAITLTKPDGIYVLTVAAMDNAGNRADVVRNITVDTAPPVVTITSPADGATLTTRPIIVSGEAYDAGTGLASLTVNGEPVAVTDGKYSVEIDPPEGDYTIVVTGTDNAGVSTTAMATVFIDTVKPELHMDTGVNIVDTETYIISGWCYDVNGVTVTVNGVSAILDNGRFSVSVPLNVGENTITVSATDGVGLTVTYERRVIRLITDRAQGDVDALLDLLTRQDLSALAQWHRGAYNHTDFNRVTAAMEFLGEILYSYGYLNTYVPEPVRNVSTIPAPADTQAYLTNVEKMRVARPLPEEHPATPEDMESFTFGEANDIEKILVQVNAILPLLEKSWLLCGEAMCGEW